MVTTHTRISETNGGMQIKTILNRIQKQRGFVYGTVQLEEQIGGLALTVDICAACAAIGRGVPVAGDPARGVRPPGATALRVRAPLGHRRGLRLCDAAGRLPGCGVTVERVPWAEGKTT